MKTQRIVAAIAAASLTLSGGAFAQTSGVQETEQLLLNDQRAIQQYQQDLRNQQRAGQRDYRADQRDNNRGYDNRGYDNRGHDNRSYDNRRYDNIGYDYRRYGYRDGGYRGHGRGVGPSYSWYRGDRMPYEYRTRHYVVDDWRGHHLYAPPRGYQWVQSGGDYLLVAVATGIIASILLSQ